MQDETTTNDIRTAAEAAAQHAAVYDFFKFQIDMDTRDHDLFIDKANGVLNTAAPEYATLWHEYTHYLQNVTTTIGVRIFLNWLQLLTRFPHTADQKNPMPVPLRFDTSLPFPFEFYDLHLEIRRLMACKVPLDLSPPAAATAFAHYLDIEDKSNAYLCVKANGQGVGVPLYGNIFIEGMAKAVTWLVEDNEGWDPSRLADRAINNTGVYYDAIIRYFAHHAPGINPCVATISVSHAALQTTHPAQFFVALHDDGMPAKVAADLQQFCADLRTRPEVKQGINDTLAELDRLERDNQANSGMFLHSAASELIQIMRDGLNAYLLEDGAFNEFNKPTPEGFHALAKRFRFPPLFTNDIDTGWCIGLSDNLQRLFMLFSAMQSLVFQVTYTDLSDQECPLLRKRYCTFKKNKKTYCHRERLAFEDINGEICIMGKAAELLGIYNKPIVRLKTSR